ncbi:MAG: MFS transporter [Chloroflexi bacterium]|nr:MFS transporter [Chloroflexota bacterium]
MRRAVSPRVRRPPPGGPRREERTLTVREWIPDAVGVLIGRRKVFYGWWLLAGAVVAMALGSGVSFWAFGLYVEPLERTFGWSRAEVSLAFSVSLLASGLTGPVIGRWIDVRGPRDAILLGAVLTALSYVLLATTRELWHWYLYSVFNSVVRQLMFFIPFMALISRWFDRRRGIAVSVLGSGFSLGGLTVLPVMGAVMARVGWERAFVFAGVTIAALFIPLGLFLVRNDPADVGAEVDGAHRTAESPPAGPRTGMPVGAALRTPQFWVLSIALTLFFSGMFGWLVHQIPFYESVGISRSAATWIVSVAAGLGIISRITLGLVADRIERFESAAVVLSGVLLVAMVSLWLNSTPAGIAFFITLWLVGTSGGPMMEALLLTRTFGVAHFGTILGAVVVVETAGQVVSPTVAGAIFDATGAYDAALVMYAGTFLAALILFAVARRLPRLVPE